MKTADDFLSEEYNKIYNNTKPGETYPEGVASWVKEIMIEFAKFHVKCALEEASKSAKTVVADHYYGIIARENINPQSILNAYSLENIK